MYVTGKVAMGMVDELDSTSSSVTEKGCFVMWQMVPDKWLLELAVGGHKIVAGSDGNVAWRHTPWLGAHAAKGGVRPLRRAFQASRSQHNTTQHNNCIYFLIPSLFYLFAGELSVRLY